MKQIKTIRNFQSLSSTISEYGLPPNLEDMVIKLKNVQDDKLRYQQLLYLAVKCPQMPSEWKISENKVIGCLSTVHIHAKIDENQRIWLTGDSDSQLTKGLVALLINGLSGSTNEEIQKVNPQFIKIAGIATSLTPGRNNGFLNMLQLIKRKSNELSSPSTIDDNNNNNNKVEILSENEKKSDLVSAVKKAVENSSNVDTSFSSGPIYDSMKKKLTMLKPSSLSIDDVSYQHAGHSETQGLGSSETHFNVKIIANCFEGLSRVQRHKMIYTLLAQEMNNGIHALSIDAKSDSEV
eukprot:gene11633-15582_t